MKLAQVIRDYVDLKQAMGSRFHTEAILLKAVCQALGDILLTEVTVEHVDAYLAGHGPVTRFWHRKASALQGLYRFAMGRGYGRCSPLPRTAPKPHSVFTPYIYTPEELRRLLHSVEASVSSRAKLSAPTMRTLLLLLYGAALRISEALALTLADVESTASVLTIHTSKFYKTRWVPIGPRLGAALAAYARERPPCAVHRLVAWYQEGADVQQRLPHLATYLGHVHIAATQCYLTMTPALLHAASQRFECYAQPEVQHG
jgi:integrase/recombinase XerD